MGESFLLRQTCTQLEETVTNRHSLKTQSALDQTDTAMIALITVCKREHYCFWEIIHLKPEALFDTQALRVRQHLEVI